MNEFYRFLGSSVIGQIFVAVGALYVLATLIWLLA